MYLQIKSIIPLSKDPQMVRMVAEGIVSVDTAYKNFDVGDRVEIKRTDDAVVTPQPQPPKRRINTRDSILKSDGS